MFRKSLLPLPLTALALAVLAACSGGGSNDNGGSSTGTTTPTVSAQDALSTTTPIKHLVVIFGENVSFDHYFGTYPQAANPAGEPSFTPASGTPVVNGLTPALLTNNPNTTNAANLAITPAIPAAELNPFRLDRSQANTKSQNHAYTAEQQAYDNGLMDAFPAFTGRGTAGSAGAFGTNAQVLGYFDGNTVTAMWNYAQHFAMSDNAYTDTFGPSTPGAIAVVSGTNAGAKMTVGTGSTVDDTQGGLTLIGDTDPGNDVCSSKTSALLMTSKNIGDLLNTKGITWGSFMGGFNLQTVNVNGTSGCTRSTFSQVLNGSPTDYVPHHAWFQYYASTANPTHARPSSITTIGYSTLADGKTAEPANHEYDSDDFFSAVSAGNFPSVSYIKAPAVGDGHPGNSDPLDEQAFVAKVVNFLQQQPDWSNTAVIVTYDDSDGWYDHRYQAPQTSSFDAKADMLNGAGKCNATGSVQGMGVNGGVVNGRCGPGTRIPFLVISPWAKANYVDDTLITQSSVIRFIEDNWLGGTRIGQGSNDAAAGSIMNLFDFSGKGANAKLFVDTGTGLPVASAQ